MRNILFTLLTLLTSLPLAAQWSATYASEDADYADAISLYEQGQYAAAQHKLEAYPNDFYYLACCFELRQKNAAKLMEQHLKAYPYTPYASEVHYMDGVLLTETGKYKKAIKAFSQVKEKELFRPHQQAFFFYQGYAYLQMSDYKKALSSFRGVQAGSGTYALQTRYYMAYCYYALGNYDKALPDFLAVENTHQYASVAPYYIVQIHYAQHNYDEVIERANRLLASDPENPSNAELHRVLGEIYYQRQNYADCVSHLKTYAKICRAQQQPLLREDTYLLGISSYRLEHYSEAVDYLRAVKAQNDSVTQSVQLHLGHAYRFLNDIPKAKQAYAAAMRLTFSDKVREEAMFNYALTNLQSSSALGEVVPAFNDFLQAYPNSAHANEVHSLLSEVYRSSKNYRQALLSLEAIPNPSPQMVLTKQYFRYKLGTDAFVNRQYAIAIGWFDQLIEQDAQLTPASRLADEAIYLRESYFFKAESQYRLKQYEPSLATLSAFLALPNAAQSDNYLLAKYLEGYIFFQQHDYAHAEQAFDAFIKRADNGQATYTDALNRLGDCAFAQRDFVRAESFYTRVIANSSAAVGADYAMFQRGYSLGLLRRYGEKINQMDRLTTTYPRSDYADDALYEIARAEVQRDNEEAAIAAYDRLLSTYPHSVLARKATLEKAMLYYNRQDYAHAIETYKQVIKNYPNTEEANSALEGLENCYVETNDVETYLAYCRTIGRIYVQNISNEDSVSFAAAERQYMLTNYEQATPSLALYLQKYCDGGRYCTMARYYLADSYYRLQRYDKALPEYVILADQNGNPWQEEAALRAAELTFDNADYAASLRYFRQLLTLSSSTERTAVARLGILRTCVRLNDDAAVISGATTIISDPISDADTRQEARYNRMLAYYRQGQLADASDDATLLAQDVRTVWGAEAEYLRAQCLYDLHQYDAAEEEVMAFANMHTPQQYWLARAFVLLSDVYMQKGDSFQAQQFLLSLQQNYTVEDDIQTRINERLAAIEALNNPVNEPENEDL